MDALENATDQLVCRIQRLSRPTGWSIPRMRRREEGEQNGG